MFDPVSIIKAVGYIGLCGIIFAESGLFFGFFLPGDSLLFTAGFLASQGFMNIYVLVPLLFIAAVLGNNVGYAFGYRIGPAFFNKQDSFFYKKGYIEKTEKYFQKYGGKTIVIARFIPVVRTFATILAGIAKMDYKNFVFYNIVGAFLWTVGLTVLGYFLGNTIPNIDRYIVPMVLVIIVVSILPGLWQLFSMLRSRK
ncbi:MAG TPA: VTT domain-containing protein [Patescibacteria group bacterium]